MVKKRGSTRRRQRGGAWYNPLSWGKQEGVEMNAPQPSFLNKIKSVFKKPAPMAPPMMNLKPSAPVPALAPTPVNLKPLELNENPTNPTVVYPPSGQASNNPLPPSVGGRRKSKGRKTRKSRKSRKARKGTKGRKH